MEKNLVTFPKYVVYRDDDYPKSWIEYHNSDAIVKYLTDKKRQKKFEKLNADKLKDWMKMLVEKGDASGYVVVFSQDVVPNTVFHDKSDALIREYLNKGGRAVWIGDIPFFIYGKKKIKIPQMQIVNGTPTYVPIDAPLDGMRFNDTYALLGSVPSFAFSESKVKITSEGEKRGLNYRWYSMRPVHPRYILSGWHHFQKEEHITAKSILTHPIREQDINPQRVKSEDVVSFSSIKGATEFLHTYFSLPAVIIALIVFLFGGVAAGLHLSNIIGGNLMGTVILLMVLVVLLFILGVNKIRKKRFASAWIKDFKNGGEFIRIWDFNPEEISNLMLEDLYNVAIWIID